MSFLIAVFCSSCCTTRYSNDENVTRRDEWLGFLSQREAAAPFIFKIN
jgi:hypothetical protein